MNGIANRMAAMLALQIAASVVGDLLTSKGPYYASAIAGPAVESPVSQPGE